MSEDRALNGSDYEVAYQQGAKIADELMAEGVPVIGFHVARFGARIGMTFQLQDEAARYTCLAPVGEASVKHFRDYYEAMK